MNGDSVAFVADDFQTRNSLHPNQLALVSNFVCILLYSLHEMSSDRVIVPQGASVLWGVCFILNVHSTVMQTCL